MLFIIAHFFYLNQYLVNPLFSIEVDFGFAEIYQYVKEFWIVLLLALIFLQRSNWIYFSWTVTFFYLLVDDSLRVHERVGKYLVARLELEPGFYLRSQDFGELLVTLAAGIILVGLNYCSYRNGNNVDKKVSRQLFGLIVLLVFFGVFVDMIHSLSIFGRSEKSILGAIEDGGEMVVISLILTFVFQLKFKIDKNVDEISD